MRHRSINVYYRAYLVWNYAKTAKDWTCPRNGIQTSTGHSAQTKPVAEYWQFDDAQVVSKFFYLKDFEYGIPQFSGLKLGTEQPVKTHWYLFRNINDNATTEVLKHSFGLDAAWQPSIRAPAKVEYVRCAKDRFGDHLLISLHDYRLQENDTDDLTGFVDDLSWINEIYESEPGQYEELKHSGQAGNNELEMPERASLLAQQMVSKEVRFYYFPANNIVITIGTESASMVRTGRAAILNNRSQVAESNLSPPHTRGSADTLCRNRASCARPTSAVSGGRRSCSCCS